MYEIYWLAIFFFIGPLAIAIFFNVKERRQKHDIIIFEQEFVDIGDEIATRIYYDDIICIELRFNAQRGDMPGKSLIPLTGHENIIKIITRNEEIVKNIWCETNADYWRLKMIGKFLYGKSVDVKMKGFPK